ncbi:pentapeptide repeat-containing protein [Pseudomonas aeruginosa]|uniref:pentapeptide repeat-containing protein n=1 Tax=Citrobacter farmeri TaxID=67824 RepID=UPI00374D6242|nr:pentapeptide repeat-containing protein [Pseudomonas aeruginosa]HCK5594470.1 pentapeptide repeat-containing protein [Pseudomonas aeruginosa]
MALKDCELEGDFSRLDLSGFVFRRCLLVETSWSAANPEETLWLQCRAGLENFERAKLIDSRSEGCDLNNIRWRRAKLASAAFRGGKLTAANFEGGGSARAGLFRKPPGRRGVVGHVFSQTALG